MQIEHRGTSIEIKVSWNDLRFGEAFWWYEELHIKINNGVGGPEDFKPIVALSTGLMANVIPTNKQFVRIDVCDIGIVIYDRPKRTVE